MMRGAMLEDLDFGILWFGDGRRERELVGGDGGLMIGWSRQASISICGRALR